MKLIYMSPAQIARILRKAEEEDAREFDPAWISRSRVFMATEEDAITELT